MRAGVSGFLGHYRRSLSHLKARPLTGKKLQSRTEMSLDVLADPRYLCAVECACVHYSRRMAMDEQRINKPKLSAEAAYENAHLVAKDLVHRISELLFDMLAPGV